MKLPALKSKTVDFIVVLGLLFISAALILTFKLSLMVSVFWYLGVPSLYLMLREKKPLVEIILASAVFGVFLGMVYNIAAENSAAWVTRYGIPGLGALAIDKTPYGDFIWAFLIPFSIFVFYEHFLDDDRPWTPAKKHWEVIAASALFFIGSLSWFLFFPNRPVHPYAYFRMGLITVLPLIGLFFARRQLVRKILLCGAYFVLLNLVFEITGRILGQWSFNGTYVATIALGSVTFPAEELFLWILPSAMVLVILYEFVFDDRR